MRTTAATLLIVACLCLICGQALAEYLPEQAQHDIISVFGETEALAGLGDQPAEVLEATDAVDTAEAAATYDGALDDPAEAHVDELGDEPDETVVEPGQDDSESVESDAGTTDTDFLTVQTDSRIAEADSEVAETDAAASEAETEDETVEGDHEGALVDGFQAGDEVSDVSPVLSRLLTREIDLLAGIPEDVDLTERPDDGDDLGAVLDRRQQIDVAEEACYVRVMSHGLASVREVRSLDLYPGRSLLRLENIPTSVLEESIFLSVWHPAADVAIKSYRLVRSDESAEFLVEVSSPDRLLGAHLEVYYLTADLEATLGYSGMYDAENASLRLSEWLTVTNLCGKDFTGAGFSFHLSELGFEHEIASAVTLQAGEKSRFLCRDHILSPATTIVKAEGGPGGEEYEITELIKVEGLRDQDLLIPPSTATIYSMDFSGFSTLVAEGSIFKPREYSWFTVETLHKPDVRVQRAQTGEEVTGAGIRDVSYMINIENRSSTDVIVTIYEWIGGNWFLRSATVDTKQVTYSRDPERPDYATFTVEVGANSSQALLYKARISDRPER
jgi:hypothetical protein